MRSITRNIAVACAGALTFLAAQPAQAQMGLSRVEYLALQQEMRDRGCGNRHAGGEVNAETRRAIRVCAQRLGVAANARAVLHAMLPFWTNSEFAGSGSGAPIVTGGMTTGGSMRSGNMGAATAGSSTTVTTPAPAPAPRATATPRATDPNRPRGVRPDVAPTPTTPRSPVVAPAPQAPAPAPSTPTPSTP